jgi:hypothetical protein
MRAWRRHFREKPNVPLDLAAIVAVAALGPYQWHAGGFGPAALCPHVLSAALASIIALALFALPHLAYRKNEKLNQAYHLQFSEDAIEFRTQMPRITA